MRREFQTGRIFFAPRCMQNRLQTNEKNKWVLHSICGSESFVSDKSTESFAGNFSAIDHESATTQQWFPAASERECLAYFLPQTTQVAYSENTYLLRQGVLTEKITLLELGLARDLSPFRSERQTIYQRHLNWLSIDMKYVIYWISASSSRFSVILLYTLWSLFTSLTCSWIIQHQQG